LDGAAIDSTVRAAAAAAAVVVVVVDTVWELSHSPLYRRIGYRRARSKTVLVKLCGCFDGAFGMIGAAAQHFGVLQR